MKPSFLSSRPFLGGVVAVLLLLCMVPASGGPAIETGLSWAGLSVVNTAAGAHITRQREQALRGFLVLSALKVGLAVLRSSEVGLILNVRIGDLAVAAYDYVNFAWKILLAAVVYYYLAELLLRFAGAVDIWFLAGALFFSGLALMAGVRLSRFRWTHRALKRFAAAAGVGALILYVALPMAFVGAGVVSDRITGSAIEEASDYFEEVRGGMPGLDGGPGKNSSASRVQTPSVTVPFPYDGTDPSQVVIEDVETGERGIARIITGIASGDAVRSAARYLEERSRELAAAATRQAAAYIFNIVVFPVLTILFLYWGSKLLLSLEPGQRLPAPRGE